MLFRVEKAFFAAFLVRFSPFRLLREKLFLYDSELNSNGSTGTFSLHHVCVGGSIRITLDRVRGSLQNNSGLQIGQAHPEIVAEMRK